MTIVEAYNKYNELKAWYDSKTEAFLYRIAVIDAKIEELKQKAIDAVGPALTKIMNTIQKWVERITNIITALQDFIAAVEAKIQQWITDKISEITNKIAEKIQQTAKEKAEAAASAAIGAPLIPEEEKPNPVKKLDYSSQYPSMPQSPEPPPPSLSITDIPDIVEKYEVTEGGGDDDTVYVKRLVLGKSFTLGQLWIDGKLECYTCEDLDRGLVWDGKEVKPNRSIKVHGQTAIPVGKYQLNFFASGMGPSSLIKLGINLLKPTVVDIGSRGDKCAGGLYEKVFCICRRTVNYACCLQ